MGKAAQEKDPKLVLGWRGLPLLTPVAGREAQSDPFNPPRFPYLTLIFSTHTFFI